MGTKKEFIRKIVKSPDFWVRFDAISTGVSVSVESGLLVAGALLPSVPFLLGGVALAGAAVLGSCAMFSLFVGVKGTLEFIKDAYHDTFRADKPKAARAEKPKTTLINRLAHHPAIYPVAKKIADTKLGKKFLNSNIGKKLQVGLTQGQRDIFMVSLNTKGSLFTGGAAVTYIVMHALALPAITLAGIATVPVFIASLYAAKSIFDISCSMRVLFKHLRQMRADKKAKKEAAKTPAPVPAPIPAPAPAPQPAAAPVPAMTPAFEKAAAAAENKPDVPAAVVPVAPVVVQPPSPQPKQPQQQPPAA